MHEHVQAVELGDEVGEAARGEVGGPADGVRKGRGERVDGVAVPAVHDHAVGAAEVLRDGAADPAGGSRDEGDGASVVGHGSSWVAVLQATDGIRPPARRAPGMT